MKQKKTILKIILGFTILVFLPFMINSSPAYAAEKQQNDTKNISDAKVVTSKEKYTYTGNSIKPKVTVYLSSGKKLSSKYYTVSYKNNIAIGKAGITVSFKGKYSGTAKGSFKIIPAKTGIKQLVSTSKGIKISWSKNNDATGYEIYRKTNGSNFVKIKTIKNGSSEAYVDKSAKSNGIKYSYKLVTYTKVNGKTYRSGESKEKSLYYISAPTLSLENTAKGVKLSWSKNTKASGYYIYRSLDGKNYSKIKTITTAITNKYVDTEANENGKKYRYKVVAYKTVSGRTYKSADSAAKKYYFIESTEIKSLTNILGGKLIVKWDKANKISGYQVQYSEYKNFSSYVSYNLNDKNSENRLISNLTKGKKYYVRIRTYKSVSGTMYYSAWSTIKSKTISSKDVTGGSDINIGNTYLEANLSEQHVYFLKDGKIIWESPCVSGHNTPSKKTPAGVYTMGYRERNATLIGDDYKTVVSYWMPFIGNSIGFHDASWRGGADKFGGNVWTYDGSHGCINLPYDAAKKLYDLVYNGLPVIVYY